MVSGMNVVPGVGVDFAAVGRVLMLVSCCTWVPSLFGWMQGVSAQHRHPAHHHVGCAATSRTKIHRLPLRYFDTSPRGDLLSRVTNDVDNISQGLQQTMSQLLISVLTVLGILIMMLWISPLLALIAILTVPAVDRGDRTDREAVAEPHFVASGSHTGVLNAQVEEAYTGHELVTGVRPQPRGRAGLRPDATNSSTRSASAPSSFPA